MGRMVRDEGGGGGGGGGDDDDDDGDNDDEDSNGGEGAGGEESPCPRWGCASCPAPMAMPLRAGDNSRSKSPSPWSFVATGTIASFYGSSGKDGINRLGFYDRVPNRYYCFSALVMRDLCSTQSFRMRHHVFRWNSHDPISLIMTASTASASTTPFPAGIVLRH
jgi:hypothetical protein